MFENFLTLINENFTVELVYFVASIIAFLGMVLFASVVGAIRDNERARKWVSILELAREFILSSIVIAEKLDDETLERIREEYEGTELASYDPRMLYVLSELDDFLDGELGFDVDISKLINYAERLFQEWDNR